MLKKRNPIAVTHIITGLSIGGAEMMLYKLLMSVDKQEFSSRVISLTEMGEIGLLIQEAGIPVTAMGMKPGLINSTSINQLVLEIKKSETAIVQTWMYHADLLGGWTAKKAGIKNIAWNIRNSTLDWRKSKFTTLATVGLCAILSHFIPEKIAVCSQAASRVHQNIGYARQKMIVIPNGFDLSTFKPDREAGLALRKELDIAPMHPVVGLAARFDEQKDHLTFFKSAAIILKKIPDVHFLLCGEGISRENPLIMQWASAAGLEANFHLLGRWSGMPKFHAACDVEVSSSAYGESFSNVLGEAMACEVPCVSTRVGGAEEVLGETGHIVPAKDAEKLAEAILDILELPENNRLAMGAASRQRIMENFEISHVAEIYMRFWEELSNAN